MKQDNYVLRSTPGASVHANPALLTAAGHPASIVGSNGESNKSLTLLTIGPSHFPRAKVGSGITTNQ